MRQKNTRIYFDEWEILECYNVVRLDDYGVFYGDYVDYEENKIYGWWFPTMAAAKYYGIDPDKAPFWASIVYIISEETKNKIFEREDDVWASDFLDAPWLFYVIQLENKNTPK